MRSNRPFRIEKSDFSFTNDVTVIALLPTWISPLNQPHSHTCSLANLNSVSLAISRINEQYRCTFWYHYRVLILPLSCAYFIARASTVLKKLQGEGRGEREAQFLQEAASHRHLKNLAVRFHRYAILLGKASLPAAEAVEQDQEQGRERDYILAESCVLRSPPEPCRAFEEVRNRP